MDQMPHHEHMHMADQPHGTGEAGAAHDRRAGHSVAMFRDKFWLSFALTIPVVFLSGDVQHWLGYTVPSFPGYSSSYEGYQGLSWPKRQSRHFIHHGHAPFASNRSTFDFGR